MTSCPHNAGMEMSKSVAKVVISLQSRNFTPQKMPPQQKIIIKIACLVAILYLCRINPITTDASNDT